MPGFGRGGRGGKVGVGGVVFQSFFFARGIWLLDFSDFPGQLRERWR